MSAAPVTSTALTRVLKTADLITTVELLFDDQERQHLERLAADIAALPFALLPLSDDVEEGRCVELILQAKNVHADIEQFRVRRVTPLNAEVKTINDICKRVLQAPLEKLDADAQRLVAAYRAAKRARIERERQEAERLKAEAAAREAAAVALAEAAQDEELREQHLHEAEMASQDQMLVEVATPLPMTRGVKTDSGTLSERTTWVLQGIHNLDEVPKEYWRDERVIAALEVALRAAVRAGIRQIPGCSIGEEGKFQRTARR